jgi:plastocyanin
MMKNHLWRRILVRKRTRSFIMLWIGIILAAASCAGLQQEVAVSPGGGEKVLAIKASSFKFEPNNIRAHKGDVIMLKIDNISGGSHNFTVKDPEGKVLESHDLPAGKVTEVRLVVSEIGAYDFYCDRPFHSAFGMRGRIVVGRDD